MASKRSRASRHLHSLADQERVDRVTAILDRIAAEKRKSTPEAVKQ
jgi:hypothetical protein